MNIYRLTRNDAGDYDENHGFVVVAASPTAARKIAAERRFGDEPRTLWLDPEASKCEQVGGYVTRAFRKPGIILTDFSAG